MLKIFNNKTVKTYYTQRELAEALGLTEHNCWYRINQGQLPEPKAVHGRKRKYYDQAMFDFIVTEMKKDKPN